MMLKDKIIFQTDITNEEITIPDLWFTCLKKNGFIIMDILVKGQISGFE